MATLNRMSRILNKLDGVPSGLRPTLQSFMFGRGVPFVGTARLDFEEVSPERVVISIRNRRRVQNHIKSVHAAAMALLAETATGFAVGIHLPDDRIPLIKSLKIDFVKRAQGDLRAVAHLTPDQVQSMLAQEKGELPVSVTVTDENGVEPIVCEVIWAWIPKKRS
jgi:acyl-coenzyme A thioesterase PaaI-like protein